MVPSSSYINIQTNSGKYIIGPNVNLSNADLTNMELTDIDLGPDGLAFFKFNYLQYSIRLRILFYQNFKKG